jgi:hypothetical protein
MNAAAQEIAAILAEVEGALREGASAEKVAALMYDESVIVASEGAPSAAWGLKEVLPRMAEFMREWGPHPRMVLKLCEPVLSEGCLAIVMLNAEVHPDKPDASVVRYCAFTAWRRAGDKWRVIREMVLSGVI